MIYIQYSSFRLQMKTTKTKQRTYSIRAMDDVTISRVSPTSCSSKAETFKKSLYDLVKYKREQYSEGSVYIC